MGSPQVGWPGALPPIEFSTPLDVRIDSPIPVADSKAIACGVFADVVATDYRLVFSELRWRN